MKEITLRNGMMALVDDEDFDRVNAHSWGAKKGRRTWYAVRKVRGRTFFMHWLILPDVKGLDVDHRNGDGLDNRRENLRYATRRQNQCNRRKARGAASRMLGVYWRRYPSGPQSGAWAATICVNRRRIKLGCFTTEEEAGRAYDEAARLHHGEFARLNFPGGAGA